MPSEDPSSSPAGGSSPPARKFNWLLNQRENIVTILFALVLALGIRTFIVEPRWIPSGSMLPTLEIRDYLGVEKISYRWGHPQRGDIIVFDPPTSLDFPGALIKRAIGLPGDRIKIEGGKVYVNGMPLSEPYIAEPPAYDCPSSDCFVTEGSDFTVPEHSYFMMGDNRNDSEDSHIWGFMPERNIIGHAAFRFWPPNRLHIFGKIAYPNLTSQQPPTVDQQELLAQ